MIYLLYASMVIATFFAWAYIHEKAHIVAANETVGVVSSQMKLYPHFYKGDFRWASVMYYMKRMPTDKEQAIISLAPRIPDLVALFLLPFGFLLSGLDVLQVMWFIFFGGGAVDLLWGSIGYSKYSDLMKAADALKISPWRLRIPGIFASLGVMSAVLFGLF